MNNNVKMGKMVARHPKQVKCIVAGNYLVNFDADVGPVQVQKWTEKWGKRRDADPGPATHHCLIVKHVLATRAKRAFNCDARRLLIQGVTLSENGLNATGPIATLTNVNHEEAVFGCRCQRKRMPLPFWSDVDFNLNVLANFVCVAPFYLFSLELSSPITAFTLSNTFSAIAARAHLTDAW